MFNTRQIAPGVEHIEDAMGVCMTLIEGKREALLIDAGYGLESVSDFVRTRTEKPVRLILTHGHHDHILGARWFAESWIHPAEMEEFLLRTGRDQRERVADQARQKGVPVPEDFLTAAIPTPKPLELSQHLGPFSSLRLPLGGREVWAIQVPGHTQGSLVFFLPEEGILLTGDDWNPCTWLWFPSSISVREWKQNMTRLLRVLETAGGKPVSRVLCSHQPTAREGEELTTFLDAVTEESIRNAHPVDMNSTIQTCQIIFPRPEWTLIFDRAKA